MDTLDKNKLPRHVAVIMDGNGRWAKARGLVRSKGHEAAPEAVRVITRTSRKLGIEVLTLYAFSSENWSRPKLEVDALMRLLSRYIQSEMDELLENGIRFKAVGDVKRLPETTRKLIDDAMTRTAHNRDMILAVALSYGGRQDIVQAARAMAEKCLAGELSPENINEAVMSSFLYTAGLPEPDLLIRTGHEFRVSNFLLWQIAYTELYFTETLWPDFREEEYLRVLKDYTRRERRFGRTSEQIELD